jgi:hypothetical protein
MDRITKTLLNDFLKTQEIVNKDESSNFEKFVNYSILSNEYNKSFDIDSISIGSGNDTGIDGLAIRVLNTFDNGRDTLTQTDTHGRKTNLRILLFHHVQQRRGNT